ncbi:MAG: winged helix-turn-helix domain-containing protein [Acidobacteria bacterium]|nr:winged helix-turn-helix domain-containing protein [Acidobacteriota bacterium]MCA1643431.1 winged helix-turn-helix domain-containing protein [Acidobacteriota bacterium]
MGKNPKTFYEFGPFRVDVAEQQLWHDGQEIPLTPKAFSVLLMLVGHAGQTLLKDDLMKGVWPDSFVEEGSLADNVSILRQALGDDAKEPRFIKTVPRRGYRFVADVVERWDEEAAVVLAEHEKTQIVVEEEHESRDADTLGVSEWANAGHSLSSPDAPARRSRRGRSPLTLTIVSVLLGVAAVAGYYGWQSRKGRTEEQTPLARSIAVLPFKSLMPEGGDPALELGMTDAIITKLSNIRQVVVRPTSAVLKYSGLTQDPLAAGREQGVDVLLDGKVQRVGDRVRVTVQLVRVSDGAPLWGSFWANGPSRTYAEPSATFDRRLNWITTTPRHMRGWRTPISFWLFTANSRRRKPTRRRRVRH